MNKTLAWLQYYSPAILRYGMAAVILWFSIQQFMNPAQWVAYVPTAIATALHMSAITLVYINASFEMVFGAMLLFGIGTRIAALLLALHLLDISWIVGYGQIGARDIGLAIATLAVFMHGSDPLSIDHPQVLQPLSKSTRITTG